MRAAGRVAPLFVEPRELGGDLRLVAEHLDDFLALDHLLNIPVEPADFGLLAAEVHGAALADAADGKKGKAQGGDHNQRQQRAEHQHEHKDAGHVQHRREKLRQALADHLAKRIGVVGVAAHQVAVVVRIIKPNRQMLHFHK